MNRAGRYTEGHYTIKRVDKLPKKGNANWLFAVRGLVLDKFYRYDVNEDKWEEIIIGSSGTVSELTNTLPSGNLIGTHNDGDELSVNINETITSISLDGNDLTYTKEGGTQDVIDLSPYLDNNNLPRIVSGTYSDITKQLTLTRDDATNFDVDLSTIGTEASSTDLGYITAPNQGTITSSTGDDTVVPVANENNAGLMPADFTDKGVIVGTISVTDSLDTSSMGLNLPTTVNIDYRRVNNIVHLGARVVSTSSTTFNSGNPSQVNLKGYVEISMTLPTISGDRADPLIKPLLVANNVPGNPTLTDPGYNTNIDLNTFNVSSGKFFFRVHIEQTATGINTYTPTFYIEATYFEV